MLILGALVLAAPMRIGVVTSGADARAASDAQFAVELRLGAMPDVTVRSAADVARAFPAPGAPASAEPVDADARRRAEALLKEATDAYLDGKGAFALDRLGLLAALEDQRSVPAVDRVRARLWRAAVFSALKDDAHSDAEALAALALAPDLKVDLTEFPPSVEEIVTRVRPRLRTATVVLSGLPAGARVWIDERAVTSPFRAAFGTHRLFASAPGHRGVGRPIDVTGDLSVPLALPAELPGDIAAAIASVSGGGTASAQDLAKLRDLARRIDADALIVVDAGATPHAAGIGSGGDPIRAVAMRDAADVATFAESAVPSLRKARPNAALSRTSMGWQIATRGALVYDARTHDVGGVAARYSGAGPALGLDVSRALWVGALDVSRVQYGLNKVRVFFRDGNSGESNGGVTTTARLAGAARPFRGGDPDGSWLQGELALNSILHEGKPVRDSAGIDTGFEPGFTILAPQAGVRGRLAFPIHAGTIAAEAAALFAPASLWSETPNGASGDSPRGGTGLAAALGARWTRGRLGIGASWRYERISAKFRSQAYFGILGGAIPDPATVVETRATFAIDAAYRF